MAWMWATGLCFGCKSVLDFNPELVPSIRDPRSGVKEPVCAECVKFVNPKRVANGLEPIVPLPGAYAPVEVP